MLALAREREMRDGVVYREKVAECFGNLILSQVWPGLRFVFISGGG